MVAGDHVPTTPLGEVLVKIGAGFPSQNGAMTGKSGVRIGRTVMSNVTGGVVTHWPAVGVKVCVVVVAVAVLTAGFHIPVIGGTLFEFIGNTGAVAF